MAVAWLETEALSPAVSDSSDRTEDEDWCLSDFPEKVQTIPFAPSSLKRKTSNPRETKSHVVNIYTKHKKIKTEVRSNIQDCAVPSLFSDYWDTAAGSTDTEGLHCCSCSSGRPSLSCCPPAVRLQQPGG